MDKLNELYLTAYLTVSSYARKIKKEFLEDERGLSGIVVAVMLCLVAVVAAIAFWKSLSTYITNMWLKITQQSTIDG
jgi:flagellin-like protein